MTILKNSLALSLIVCASALKVLIVTHGSDEASGASYIKNWLTPHERIDESDIDVKWYYDVDWVNSPPEN
jgi:hypothetical protein